jgi:hypothetical protein
MDDQIAQQIADQLALIAKGVEVQNDHLASIATRLDDIRDEVNYVGQSVVSLSEPPAAE